MGYISNHAQRYLNSIISDSKQNDNHSTGLKVLLITLVVCFNIYCDNSC